MTRTLRRLDAVDDVELGIRLLRGTPTNEGRDDAQLRRISIAAQRFGADLAADHTAPADGAVVVERSGGDRSVVARYLPRRGRIELFTDTVAHCESVVARLGWTDRFPPGTVRAAAVLHERAHERITHRRAAELRAAVGVPALRLGRWTRWAYVAGAEELAAHAYAGAVLGLPRSPLLITAAAMAAIEED